MVASAFGAQVENRRGFVAHTWAVALVLPEFRILALHETVGSSRSFGLTFFDVTKQRGRGDVSRQLGARRQEIQDDESIGNRNVSSARSIG